MEEKGGVSLEQVRKSGVKGFGVSSKNLVNSK